MSKSRPEWINTEFTPTEECLIEVIDMPKFTELEKTKLVMQYSFVISDRAFRFLLDRIMLIEGIKQILKDKHDKNGI